MWQPNFSQSQVSSLFVNIPMKPINPNVPAYIKYDIPLQSNLEIYRIN